MCIIIKLVGLFYLLLAVVLAYIALTAIGSPALPIEVSNNPITAVLITISGLLSLSAASIYCFNCPKVAKALANLGFYIGLAGFAIILFNQIF